MRIVKLNESQLDDIFNDPILNEPSEFSFDYLKSVDWDGWQDLVAYCQRCGLHQIGRGIGRIVYAIDDKFVLKIATNNREQNDHELHIWKNMSDDLRWFVPTIFAFDKFGINPLWIVSERVLTAKYVDFQKLLGIDFGSYTSQQDINDMNNDLETYSNYSGKKNNESHINLMDFLEDYGAGDLEMYSTELKKNKWLNDLYRMLSRGYASYYELENIENWGLVIRNGKPCIIIIDTGM